MSERSAAFEYGLTCGRLKRTFVERAAAEGLTPAEVQAALRIEADVKKYHDMAHEYQETGGESDTEVTPGVAGAHHV